MNTCRLCQKNVVATLLDFGPQPLCNRFLTDPRAAEYTHPLTIGQCDACGTIQLINPPPAAELKPRVDWISYREPEPHLDHVADLIRDLPGINENSVIGGISYKEDTTLRRLEARGLKNTWRLDMRTDLGIDDPCAGIETIQASLAKAPVKQQADVLIARHILEHAHDIRGFMNDLKKFIKPGGYVVMESPDCRRALEQCDYSTAWEEHVFYFTAQTFQNCFAIGGFKLHHFQSYPYALENSLVGIARVDDQAQPAPVSEGAIGRAFRDNFAPKNIQLNKDLRQRPGKIAFLGAGHLSCVFINIFGLKDRIEFVVDDNSHKQGLYMPGSRLPIRGSRALLDENIQLCLLCLSPETEDKVIANNKQFVERGGKFASIFAGSQYAL